jgi:hypothetical protein
MTHKCHKASVEMIGLNVAMSSWEPEPIIISTVTG